MWILGIVFFLWGIVVSTMVPFATGFFAKLATVLVAWGPVALLSWFLIARAFGREKLHAAMLGGLGIIAGQGLDHSEEGTGIALDPKSKTLGLLCDGGYQLYPFDKIREWASNEERPGGVVGFGVQGAIGAAGANIRAAREAAANTGLFVTVKDVGRPSWRVAMKDKAMRARWMEILQQEINETAH
ncbi:hypothetical protein CR152_15600 [Massilia violaceinigra]|uniref:Uncharacterized protein n=1 Tax=Massilia violaceinigra TaxID=2045208 RepID=A0A2D2DLF7_9BURK|nr:DUF4755 domain-containing protein [Massilia violaceinigra]ATQ75791.1 hypothetical protein CR152_15600 [Massilia violaceinigra]